MNHSSLFQRLSKYSLLAWLLIFVLAPNLLVILTSLLKRNETGWVELSFSLHNYGRLLEPVYLRVFSLSFGLAFFTTLLCLFIGYPFALICARLNPAIRPILLTLVIIPFWTNSLIRTYAIRSLLAAKGIVNNGLLTLGFIDEPIRMLYTHNSVILGMVYVLLPFMILPLYISLEKLDWRLVEAAADLGASPVKRWVFIILPLTVPGIIAGSSLVFMPALGLFFINDVLGGSKGILLGNFLKDQFLEARDWPFGAAASVILILLLFGFISLYQMTSQRVASQESV